MDNRKMGVEIEDTLKEIYRGFVEEKEEIQKLLQKNLDRIQQIEIFLSSLHEKQETDFKVFSPWSVEKIYKDQIEQSNREKQNLEEENREYYRKINNLTKRIENIGQLVPGFLEKGELSPGPEKEVSVPPQDVMRQNMYVLDIQEKERQRIARDLHDTSLQNLAHLVHKIELSSLYIDKDPVRAKLELADTNKELKKIIQEIRNTVFNLRPMSFDDLGWRDAYARLFSNMEECSAFHIEAQIEDIPFKEQLVLMTIFRVIQECVTNAIKHSGGNEVRVQIRSEGEICLIEIADNGNGFDVDEVLTQKDRHFGLCILKERVSLLSGKIKFDSGPEGGTVVRIWIPVSKEL